MTDQGSSAEQWFDIAKRKAAAWVIATIDPLLLIVHLTVIYVAFLKADDLVLGQIEVSFRHIIEEAPAVAEFLKGVKIFSALGVGIGYGLHVISQLWRQARHLANTVSSRQESGQQ